MLNSDLVVFSEEGIPIVDISCLKKGREESVLELADVVCDVSKEIGFFYIKGHGVSQALMSHVYEKANDFFCAPIEERMSCYIGNSPSHSGYVPLTEKGVYSDESGDRKYESFDISTETIFSIEEKAKGNIFNGPNTWPLISGFKETVKEYYDSMQVLSFELCYLFEIGLGIPEGYFKKQMKNPLSQLRLIHYVENNDKPSVDDMNMGAHTDYECFTILSQQERGLQTQNINGVWVDALPIPGTFVVNIGDILEIISNGNLKSNLHRVVNLNKERFSIPFFACMEFDSIAEPMIKNSCQKYDYKPVVVGEHVVRQITRDFSYLRERMSEGIEFLGENPYEKTVTAKHL